MARLESVSRSPIYADFSQALTGTSSIRAYKDESRFINSLEARVDSNSIAGIISQIGANWLAIRLDMLGSLTSFFIAVIAVAADGFIPAGYLALGLTYSFGLTAYLKFAVRVMATGEAQMNSVERLKYYADNVVQEGDSGVAQIDVKSLPAEWPVRGAVSGTDVQMRYRDGPLVLKGLSFDVAAGEKIGIAGRTGYAFVLFQIISFLSCLFTSFAALSLQIW